MQGTLPQQLEKVPGGLSSAHRGEAIFFNFKWFLIGGLEHDVYFSVHWEWNNIPIDYKIFFRGVALHHQPGFLMARIALFEASISQRTAAVLFCLGSSCQLAVKLDGKKACAKNMTEIRLGVVTRD